MKVMKRLVSWILCLTMILSMAPTSLGAAGSARIYATSPETQVGGWFSVEIRAENLDNLASLELEIHYDSDILELDSVSDAYLIYGYNAYHSVNRSIAGTIRTSTAWLTPVSGSDTLMYLHFRVKDGVDPCTTRINVAVGDAHNGSLQHIDISGGYGIVTIRENPQMTQQEFYVGGYLSPYEVQTGELVTLTLYNSDSWEGRDLGSGVFDITYDDTLFEVESVDLSYEMAASDAVYSINKSVDGRVRISYAATYSKSCYDLMTVTFRAIHTESAETNIGYRIYDAYDGDRQPYSGYASSCYVRLLATETEEDKPALQLISEEMKVGEESTSILQLEGEAGVAAADFFVNYDARVLECVKVEAADGIAGSGIMLTINPNYKNGTIKFSYINQNPSKEALNLIKIVWKPKQSPSSHRIITVGGSGVIDREYQDVSLYYPADTDCILEYESRPVTCTEDGYERYVCHGCQYMDMLEHTPALGHAYGKPEFTWAANYASCSAKQICAHDASHVLVTDCEITVETEDADCYHPGTVTYTATVGEYTDVKTVHVEAAHSYGQWRETTPTSCMAPGERTRTCSACGDVQRDPIPQLDHIFTCYYSDGNATGDEDGTKTAWCDYGCGTKDTIPDPGSALGHHFYDYYSDGNATCTEDGTMTAYCWCGCGRTDTVVEEGSAYGHWFESYTVESNPTCMEPGWEVSVCENCEEETDYREIPTVDHKFTTYISNGDATPDEDGTKTAYCDYGCGTTDTIVDIGSAQGHSFQNYVSDGNATCMSDGTMTAQCICGCGRTDTIVEPGSRLPHSFTDYMSDDNASCYYDGTMTAWCDYGCGTSDTVTDEGSGGCLFEWYDPYAGTTCDSGLGWISWCSRGCGNYDLYYDDPTEHNWCENGVLQWPSCEQMGVTEYYCNVCWTWKVEETPALGHIFNHYQRADGSNCETGLGWISWCDRCSATDIYYDEPKEHNWDEGWTSSWPSCESEGEKYYSCLDCYNMKREILPALGHDWDKGVLHTPVDCEQDGESLYTCMRCYITKIETEPAWGHSFTNYIPDNNATCMYDGSKTAVCDHGCGTVDMQVDEGTRIPHKFTNYVSDGNATPEQDGTKTAYCDYGCGTFDTIIDEGSAQGHSFLNYVSDGNATCMEDGTMTAQCECGCGRTNTIPEPGTKLPHQFEHYVEEIPPTCVDNGREVAVCEMCGVETDYRSIPETGHTWDDGVVTEEPSTDKPGTMLYTCVTCGETYEEEIAPSINVEERFDDVEGHWALDAIAFAVNNGLMNGTGDGSSFSPDMPMSRAMLVTVLHRYSGSPDPGDSHFADVTSADWFYPGVSWAANNGVVNGVGDGSRFDPNGDVTREMMATILFRYAGKIGLDTSKRADISQFPDAASVAGWSYEAVQWAVAEGIIGGAVKDGQTVLAPQDSANRAVVATIMMRFIQNVVEGGQ